MTCPAGTGCKSPWAAPAASPPVPKGAEDPKTHLHFQLPSVKPASCPPLTAVQAEGAPGQNSAWSEILAGFEQRHLGLYLKQSISIFVIHEGK